MPIKISHEGVAITERFFEAIDLLIASRQLRGFKTFTSRYDVNRRNLRHVQLNPQNAVLKPELLAILARDFNISSEWLLLGTGTMFYQKNDSSQISTPKSDNI